MLHNGYFKTRMEQKTSNSWAGSPCLARGRQIYHLLYVIFAYFRSLKPFCQEDFSIFQYILFMLWFVASKPSFLALRWPLRERLEATCESRRCKCKPGFCNHHGSCVLESEANRWLGGSQLVSLASWHSVKLILKVTRGASGTRRRPATSSVALPCWEMPLASCLEAQGVLRFAWRLLPQPGTSWLVRQSMTGGWWEI